MADKPILGALLLLLLGLAGCAQEGPEARLRTALAEMETAVEGKRPGAFMDWVAEDFSGDHGQFDRRSLHGLIAGQLLSSEKIEVILASPQIVLHGERATVTVSVVVTGGKFLPERAEKLTITSGWRLTDGEWRCYTAEWER